MPNSSFARRGSVKAHLYRSTYCLFDVIDFGDAGPAAAITIETPCYSVSAVLGDFYSYCGADRGLPQLLSFDFKKDSAYFLWLGVLTHSPYSGS